jgi:hypothetical protein
LLRNRNRNEELYDHQQAQYEWRNVADDPKYKQAKTALAEWLPRVDAPDIEISPAMTPLEDAWWADDSSLSCFRSSAHRTSR